MRLNVEVSLMCSRTSSSSVVIFVDVSVVAIATVSGLSTLVVVVDISVIAIGTVSASVFVIVVDTSVVAIATVAVVVDIVGILRDRGTVDIPRLMMVCVLLRSGVNVGASIPN
jgi:hypothetical protein